MTAEGSTPEAPVPEEPLQEAPLPEEPLSRGALPEGSVGDGERSDLIDRLVSEYIDRLTAGEILDREKIAAEHGELAAEILERLEIFQEVGGLSAPQPVLGALGDYSLLRKLGRGGMGIVYEAWQNSMDRRVALKILPGALAADTKTVTRFVREARLAGRLHHPNIVSVYGMGVEAETPYYAMEYVEGETLAEILDRLQASRRDASGAETRIILSGIAKALGSSGVKESLQAGRKDASSAAEAAAAPKNPKAATADRAMEAAETASSPARGSPGQGGLEAGAVDLVYFARVAAAFAGVADGLHHAHQQKIIHRDIKPSNLILETAGGQGGSFQGRLRILDFGLAHLEGHASITASGDFLGTPLYMSPEQARARKVPLDHRTDIYSLGATLYEMLTWRPPFHGKDFQETLSQIISREPDAPRKVNPCIPRDLETIALKCIEKEPADRYKTAEDVAQDLRRFVRGEPIEARPQSALEKLGRRARRNKGRITATALAVLLVLTSGLLIHGRWRERRDAELRIAQEAHAAKLAKWKDKVLRAVVKMEIGRPADARAAGGAPAREGAAESPGPEEPARTGSGGEASGREASGSVAYALETQLLSRRPPDPLQEALADLEEAAALFPEKPETHYHLARALGSLKRGAEARAALERALACDPTFAPARIVLSARAGKLGDSGALEGAQSEKLPGERVDREKADAESVDAEKVDGAAWVRTWLEAQQAQDERRWEEAARAWGQLIRLETAGEEPYIGFSISIRVARGRARLEAGDLDGALEDFGAAHALWPDSVEPVVLLGKAYFLKGNPARAEERFREFHGQRPPHEADDVAFKIGGLYFDLKQYEKALEWDQKAAESSKREARRATDLSCLGRLDEAIRADARALELDPKNVDAVSDMGLNFWLQGKREEAIAKYREALKLDPNLSHAHHNLGRALLAQGDPEAAALELREAIRLHRNVSLQHEDHGRALMTMGKHGEAAAEFTRAIQLDPKYVSAFDNLGFVLLQQNKLKEAEDVLRKAVRLDANLHGPQCKLGQALVQQGKYEEAFPELRKAAELDPSCRPGLQYIQKILRTGKFQLDEELKLFTERLEKVVRSSADPSPLLLETLALSFGYDSAANSPEKALEYARRAVQRTQGRSFQALMIVAETEYELKNFEAAIVALERVVSLPDANSTLLSLLESWRREFLPGLASYASIDAALDFREILVPEDAAWRYFPGKEEPPVAWSELDFDDASWSEGKSGFGYGKEDAATVLDDMRGSYSTLYIRRAFDVADPAALQRGIVLVKPDDGCVVHANGKEVGRVRAGERGKPLAFDAVASANAFEPVSAIELTFDPGVLRAGKNVLAIQGLNRTRDSSDFLLVPSLCVELLPDLERDRERLEKAIALAREKGTPHRAAYLEGRLLQRAGKPREAVEKFQEALATDAAHAEPYARLAECLRVLGEPAAAESRLREALARGLEDSQPLWDLWFAVCAVELKRAAEDMLSALPGSEPLGRKAGDLPRADLKWLLGELAGRGAVRFNCGGDDYRDKAGNLWGKDRFFLGGWVPPKSGHPVQGTEDDALYQAARCFVSLLRPPYAYRIPLLPGRYRVTLCFSDCGFSIVGMEPVARKYDVLLEGRRVLEGYEPKLSAAENLSFEQAIDDGHLDLEFVAGQGEPVISAIGIEVLR